MALEKILEIFNTITKIPHCSFNTSKLQRYIIDECKASGCEVEVDKAGNILASKGVPKVCLQSHYDMVCVGKAPDIVLVQRKGFLRAEDSSLGADNGIGVAMMLYLLKTKENIEALFTNDEEVGLIGANNLELKIKSKYLLNLDSEEEGDICLGCAGGVDIVATKKFTKIPTDKRYFYTLKARGFQGGHSGVDIDKNIKNSIKHIGYFCIENSCEIVSFEAGEARNAIPKSAKVIVATNKQMQSSEYIEVKKCDKRYKVLDIGDELLEFIVAFASGVRSYDNSIHSVLTSINLATIKEQKDSIMIEISPRAMSQEQMQELVLETKTMLKKFGFEFKLEHPYPAWKPYKGEFAQKVMKISQKYFQNPKFYTIHAGLECGVLISKNPHLQAVSIGPNIHYPHSTKEEVELESIKRVFEIVDEVVKLKLQL